MEAKAKGYPVSGLWFKVGNINCVKWSVNSVVHILARYAKNVS